MVYAQRPSAGVIFVAAAERSHEKPGRKGERRRRRDGRSAGGEADADADVMGEVRAGRGTATPRCLRKSRIGSKKPRCSEKCGRGKRDGEAE